MNERVLQDWTESEGRLDGASPVSVEYRIIRIDGALMQQIRDRGGRHLTTCELPEGLRMDRQSYEVMLQYALSQLAA